MSLRAQVLKYLEDHANLRVFSTDMAQELGITKEQVHGAINGIKQNPDLAGCLVTQASGVYVWSNHPVAGGSIFEKIGQSKDGRLVLQDEDGNLYVATAI